MPPSKSPPRSPSAARVNVSKAGNGSGVVTSAPAGIDCGAACNANFTVGTVVTLTAAANVGSTFTGWSGDCTGGGACQVTMDAARHVTATFAQSGQPIIQVNGQAIAGQPVEFVATLGMSNAGACTWDFDDGASAPCALSLSASDAEAIDAITVYVTHTFAQPGQYDVTITASNAAGTVQASLPVTVEERRLFLPLVSR